MPHEMSAGKPTTRRYSEAEKRRTVRAVRQLRKELGTDHGTIRRVADQLGIGTESLRAWVRQAEIDDGVKPGLSTEDAEKMKRLEQEKRELKRRTRSSARRRRISPRRSSIAHRSDRRTVRCSVAWESAIEPPRFRVSSTVS